MVLILFRVSAINVFNLISSTMASSIKSFSISSNFALFCISISLGKPQCPSEVASSNTWATPALALTKEFFAIPKLPAIVSAETKPIPLISLAS